MKKTIVITTQIEEVDDIICNKCGKSLKEEIRDGMVLINEEFCGLMETEVYGQYYSPYLENGQIYRFSLCEKCLKNLFRRFKIPVEKESYPLFGG
jgi:hypothetical protein